MKPRPTFASSLPAPRRADPMTVTLADICRRVAALEYQVGTLLRRRDIHDPLADARLLSSIAAKGERAFRASDLARHAQHDSELRQALDGCTPRRIGKRLRRLASYPIAGYTVEVVTRDSGGRMWVVRASGD